MSPRPQKPLAEHVPSASNPVPPSYKVFEGMLALWDTSRKPANNSRIRDADGLSPHEKRLGHHRGTWGVAVCEFDEDTNKQILADGMDHPLGKKTIRTRKITRQLFEPHNWVYREHGGFIDKVWAFRMIADHTNKHNAAECASTFVVDEQRNMASNAHLSEVFWVKDINVETDDPSMFFDAAGFLEGICDPPDVPTGEPGKTTASRAAGSGVSGLPTVASQAAGVAAGQTRALPRAQAGAGTEALPRTFEVKGRPRFHTAFNANREAGFVTDGRHIGQLTHVFALRKAIQVGKNRFNELLVTMGIWTNVIFYSNPAQWGPLDFGVTPPGVEGLQVVGQSCPTLVLTDGEIRTGAHHWNVDRTQCMESLLHPVDVSEDGKAIPRKKNKAIHVYVKIPRQPFVVTPPSDVPPDFPDIPGPPPVFTPSSDSIGPTATTRWREDRAVGRGGTIAIPLDIPTGEGLNILTNIVPPAGDPATESTQWQMDAVFSKPGDILDTLIRGATARIDVPDETSANTERLLNFFIPHDLINAFKGGKVHLAHYLRGDVAATTSSGPSHVVEGGWLRHFGTRIASGSFFRDIEMLAPLID